MSWINKLRFQKREICFRIFATLIDGTPVKFLAALFECPQRKRPKRRRCIDGYRNRSGVAAVEAAILLPLMFVIVFGAIEVANGIFLRQSLTVAAYEGARSATRSGGTAVQARQRVREVLQARGVTGETVNITPDVTATTPRGTMVTVTVSTPGAAQAMNPLRLLEGRIIQQTVVMVRL
jgi:Flp pilus assembly protein TadG